MNSLEDNESVAQIVEKFQLRNPGMKATIDGFENGDVIVNVSNGTWVHGFVGPMEQLNGRYDLWLDREMDKLAEELRQRTSSEEFTL